MSTGNRIPTRSRDLVNARERGRCLRCSGRGAELCHRRRRDVADEHQHCPCNLWRGCRTCHQTWQHANPIAAMSQGFAVSAHEPEPSTVPVEAWYGTVTLLCDGSVELVEE